VAFIIGNYLGGQPLFIRHQHPHPHHWHVGRIFAVSWRLVLAADDFHHPGHPLGYSLSMLLGVKFHKLIGLGWTRLLAMHHPGRGLDYRLHLLHHWIRQEGGHWKYTAVLWNLVWELALEPLRADHFRRWHHSHRIAPSHHLWIQLWRCHGQRCLNFLPNLPCCTLCLRLLCHGKSCPLLIERSRRAVFVLRRPEIPPPKPST